ncbi:RdgB/HAM1 family non-canonical purine NTP pyrophosphatase [Nitratireductor luteus]|uniref:RdgB/HAM1 family non-canonical purine NTP pyrophosphatase n=1 Tax=Nitratireductor luteus TaxID=2976980 RepID=UPI002240AF73
MREIKDRKFVLASHNKGKLKEFAGLLQPFGFEVRSAAELGLAEPEETGTSFEENAYIKALAAAKATGIPALADDSGMCADALDSAPGVYTADWATLPDGSRDFGVAMEKVERLLREKGAETPQERRARFVAVLCLCLPDGEAEYYRGEVEGHLVWPPRGELGFGYDPVFQPEGYSTTFGEMSADQKHGWKPGEETALSHRARAFKLFAEARLARP